jgi:hypothetical protein
MHRGIDLYSNDILAYPRTKMAICSISATATLAQNHNALPSATLTAYRLISTIDTNIERLA